MSAISAEILYNALTMIPSCAIILWGLFRLNRSKTASTKITRLTTIALACLLASETTSLIVSWLISGDFIALSVSDDIFVVSLIGGMNRLLFWVGLFLLVKLLISRDKNPCSVNAG